jgi:hypothetical protein
VHFDANSLKWTLVPDNHLWHNVAAISEDRLADFIAGEEERGATELLRRGQAKKKPTVWLDDVYFCWNETQRNPELRDKSTSQEAFEEVVESGKLHCAALGENAKCGCPYHFQV